jgi:hypothetical protein
MMAVGLILGHVVDHDLCPCLPDLMTDRGLELESAAGSEAEFDVGAHRACDPALLSHLGRHGRKAHAGSAAGNFQDSWHSLDTVNGAKIRLKVSRHVGRVPFVLAHLNQLKPLCHLQSKERAS